MNERGPNVPMSPRDRILAWIEADRDRLVAFLSTFVAIPSANPPGDTRQAADFLLRWLREQGAPAEIRAAKDHLPNVVGSFEAGRSGRHLVLNGHIDVFPAGPAEAWSRDPWSGAVENGRVHGRGVADMKCGTAASLWTYVYLHRLRDEIGGRLTLTCVSDEETGGTWGAQWLVDRFPEEFRGDCMLNGEPSVPTMVRFGEKGTLRLAIEIDTPGAHAAYTHASPNAIRLAASLIGDLYDLEGLPVVHDEALVRAIAAGAEVIDAGLGDGASKILNKVTVSVGTIQGGVKINMLPGHCRFEVDIRLPAGLTHAVLLAEVERILGRYPQAKLTPIWTHSCEPTLSAPDHEMVAILKRTVRELGRVEPVGSVSLGATDCKHWRRSGVPSYVYGCSPTNMAKPDEYVEVEDYLHVVRTHALAAAAYLAL
jgi:succinyl-diaminopimelate desuccinylase